MAVYDDEKEKTIAPQPDGSHDDLGLSPEERKAETDKLEKSFSSDQLAQAEHSPSAQKTDKASSKESDKLAEDEGWYKGQGGNSEFKGKGFWTRRKKIAGGGVVGGLLVGLIVSFLALIPLKIEHIVDNLQYHFFASSESAVSNESHTMLTNYLKKYVSPALTKCGSTLSKDCSVTVVGTNPVSNLYKGWSQARLENKLAENYGIEFKYDSNSKTYFIKTPNMGNGGQEAISKPGEGHIDDALFQSADRGQVRQAVDDAFQDETKVKQLMYHFKVGRLLEEKYGIKRCLVFCNGKDAFADKVDSQKSAAKILLAERVITPRNAALGIVLQCLFDKGCDPTKTETHPCTEGQDCELNGAPENAETDTKIRTTLDELAAKYGFEDVDQLVQIYNDVSEAGGLQNYIIKQVLTPILGEDLTDAAIPVIGWIGLASSISNVVQNLDSANGKLQKLTYITNAAAAVSLYMAYRSFADEMKTGHDNAVEVGSFVSSLNPGQGDVGGSAAAEGTPLYSTLIDGNQPRAPTSFLNGILSAPAYAAGTTSDSSTPSYTCNDGGSVPAGKLVCPEEQLGQGNDILAFIHTVLRTSGIAELANFWQQTGGRLGNVVNDIIGFFSNTLVTGLETILEIDPFTKVAMQQAKNLEVSVIKHIQDFLTSELVPNPFGSNMSGGRTFDMMAAGADVAGNDYAHNGLGGQKLSNQQVSDILNQQEEQDKQDFRSESFFARLTDTNSQYSLISQVAMAVPTNADSFAQNSFSDLLSNPFGKLFSSFGSLFTNQASGQTPPIDDPFGVVQYGYPTNDPIFSTDPETYWNQHCSDGADGQYTQNWNQAATKNTDPKTGMPVNTTTNGCLLIQATTGSAGGLFDQSLLTPDDLADSSATPQSSFNDSGQSSNKRQEAIGPKDTLFGSVSSGSGLCNIFLPAGIGISSFNICRSRTQAAVGAL